MIKDNYKLLHVLNSTTKVTFGILFIKNGFSVEKYARDYLIILKRLIFLTIFFIIWDYYYSKFENTYIFDIEE